MRIPSIEELGREPAPHDVPLGEPINAARLRAILFEHRDDELLRAVLQYLRNEAHANGETAGVAQDHGEVVEMGAAVGARRGLLVAFWELLEFCQPVKRDETTTSA